MNTFFVLLELHEFIIPYSLESEVRLPLPEAKVSFCPLVRDRVIKIGQGQNVQGLRFIRYLLGNEQKTEK